MELTKKSETATHVVFVAPNARLSVRKSRIEGDIPSKIHLSGITLGVASASLTPEQRKAAAEARKNMTPAQKLDAQKKLLEKQRARVAKMEKA